ncbi:adenylate/guanylate cyclase domain-containing protein [Mycobacterium sp. 3519A]|uniref:adenylate/guanylate cyclase domain-containing protein n=1 Tax=Mycobacterium sp. 3519A TaxID=2057184 RepID=UPI0021006C2F|nr:adenylate/guanylate cyclase domain-containing protein [Mycobacterium sp. 3519A]
MDADLDSRATALTCGTCGAPHGPAAKFCADCGARLPLVRRSAEYKQVTVLFADVVHSMDIAAAVGAERLREIMAEVADRSARCVARFGGTVGSFTGDGIMAIFGAPVALEDHAVRACLAGLAIQDDAKQLAVDVRNRDGIELRLRVGLNSGQVIAGDIGTGPFGYTTIGEQVGMAQRMESVAPPGGVMLSASTARLVEHSATLSEQEFVKIKGAGDPVPAHRLLGMADHHATVRRAESNLVGRQAELKAVEELLARAREGHGSVVQVVGPPGIGKSRLAREVSALATARGVDVFTAHCESHTSHVPFYAVGQLLRAANGIAGLDPQTARASLRNKVTEADDESMLLLDDLLGIADPAAQLPAIDPDARRRRLTALVTATSLQREHAAVYVVEDAHWLDVVSESMLVDLFAVISQTPSLVVVTYRPEYRGALATTSGARRIALEPLSDDEAATLIAELLGTDPTVAAVGTMIAERAAGTPYFAEEIVRDLAERKVLRGKPGAYTSTTEIADVSVPPTLQATIAARIDRLEQSAKRTLSAAAVIGARFRVDLVTALGVEPAVDALVTGQLIDPVGSTGEEYAFHHPLIRAVAYESQLKSDRAELHRRVAAAIAARDPESVEETAALIADHLEAADDLHAAFEWHMRAGDWLRHRDIAGARMSWERARAVADRLPDDADGRMAMRIAPRTWLCATIWRAGGSLDDACFDELRELTTAAGDKRSLVIGTTGRVTLLQFHGKYREASRLASEHVQLLDSIGDRELTVGLLMTAMIVKWAVGEVTEAMQLSQRAIDMARGDPMMGNFIVGSPLAFALVMRASARCALGVPGWREDFDDAVSLARDTDKFTFCAVVMFKYIATQSWALLADEEALRDTAQALEIASQFGDDFTLTNAEFTRGLVLVRCDGADRTLGFELLDRARRVAREHRNLIVAAWCVDIDVATEKTRLGDHDGAIALCRAVLQDEIQAGEMTNRGWCTAVLVQALLGRGDIDAAQIAIDELAAMPAEPGFLYHELPLLRCNALLAKARGDEERYRDFRDRYRARAQWSGFEGHIALARAMR